MVGPLVTPLIQQSTNQIPVPVPPKPRVRTTMSDEETISWFQSWASVPLPCEYCDTLYIPLSLARLVPPLVGAALIVDDESNDPLHLSELQGLDMRCMLETWVYKFMHGGS